MAGLGRRTFQAGEVLTASNVMAYLQDQAVMNFAGTAARGSAIGTAASEGMVSYLADNNFVQTYDGTGWRSIGGVQVASGTATRDALLPSPIQGDKVFRNDLGFEQTYYGAHGTANPGGRAAAGWYNDQRNIGLVPIVPPTVNYSGGTATANTLGTVSFTGVTSLSLNGVFTSAYKNYRVIITGLLATTGAYPALNAYFRNAGTNTTSNYWAWGLTVRNAAGFAQQGGSNTSAWPLGSTIGVSGYAMATFEIGSPALSKITTGQMTMGGFDSGTSVYTANTLFLNDTTSYDGFSFSPTASSITGEVTVYGYNS